MTYTTLTKISISFIYGSPWSVIFGITNNLLHSGGMYYTVVLQILIHVTILFVDSVYKTFQFLFMSLKTGKCSSFNQLTLILDHIILQTY